MGWFFLLIYKNLYYILPFLYFPQIDECVMRPEDFAVWVRNIKTEMRKDYESELVFYL